MTVTVRRKSFLPMQVKAGGLGLASFVVATFGAEDLDGDVTEPGFFGRQTVPVLPSHDALWAAAHPTPPTPAPAAISSTGTHSRRGRG
jgi:hypothetical protein